MRISVVIPVYNPGHLLDRALDSVLGQTRPPDEILVVDDGSDREVGSDLVGRYPKVRFHRRPHLGVSAARNAGIQLAEGDLIAFMDGDDLFLPTKLEHQAAVFERHPRTCLVNSGWQVMDEAGQTLSTMRPWEQAPRLDLKTWLLWKPVLPGALIIRRRSLLAVGGFDESLSHAEDVDLVLRLSLAGCQSRWLREATLRYRRHSGSASMDLARQADGILRVLDGFFSRTDLPGGIRPWRRAVRYYTLLWILESHITRGLHDGLGDYLKQALATRSLSPDLAALEVASDIQERIPASAQASQVFRRLYPAFRQALALDGDEWARFERGLELGLALATWTGAPEQELFADGAWSELDSERLIRTFQFTLMRRPKPGALERVESVWRQALAAGLIPADQHSRVVTLYLTVMGWAVYNRVWRIAAAAALRAVAGAGSAGGVAAWLRFFRAAWRYYLGRLRREADGSQAAALLLGASVDLDQGP